jgi:hypothetical protein
MDEKREWTNFGSCREIRLLAGPDDANQKGEADGCEDREGDQEGLEEGEPSHSVGFVCPVKTRQKRPSNDNNHTCFGLEEMSHPSSPRIYFIRFFSTLWTPGSPDWDGWIKAHPIENQRQSHDPPFRKNLRSSVIIRG